MKKYILLTTIFFLTINLFIGCNKNYTKNESYEDFINNVKFIKALNVNNYASKSVDDEEASFVLEIMYYYPKTLKDPMKDNIKEAIFDNDKIKVTDIETLNEVETESYILSSLNIRGIFLDEKVESEKINVKLGNDKTIEISYGKLVNSPPNFNNFQQGYSSDFNTSNTIIVSKEGPSILGISNLSNKDITVLDVIIDKDYFSLNSDFKIETFSPGFSGDIGNLDVKPLDNSYVNFYYDIIVKYKIDDKEFYYCSPLGTNEGIYLIEYSDELLESLSD